jgi:hypothetical protein
MTIGPSSRGVGEIGVAILLALIVGGLALGIWIFASAMEARAYNRVTGANVSTWEAMWVELRVQGAPEKP